MWRVMIVHHKFTDIKLEIVALKLVEVRLGRDNIIRVAERFSHQFPSKIRNN